MASRPDWQGFVRQRLHLPALTAEHEARIRRELAAQLEDVYQDAVAGGAGEPEARALAERQITDWPGLARDVVAAAAPHRRPAAERLADRIDGRSAPCRGGSTVLSDAIRDVRQTFRQLARAPVFTLVAVTTLAVGIGATSAIFSVVNGVLLRPLPYPDPDRLVRIHEIVPEYGRFSVAPATFLDWRQQNAVFGSVGAYTPQSATLAADEGPERVAAAAISWDVFPTLGVEPLLGRTFRPDEDAPDQNAVVVLSHGAWQRRFGGAADILGRTLPLNGRPVTVIGVMPAGFYFPTGEAELWTPLALDPARASRGAHFLAVIGRLKAEVGPEQAGAEMRGISERLAAAYPDSSANESAEVVLLHEQVVGRIRPALLTLLAAVAVVVLIACANVANLLLVRASIRGREIAIRAALGARRSRLALQLLTESLVLAALGGTLGVVLAWLAIGPLQQLSAGAVPRVDEVALDVRVLAFAAGVSMLTGLIFGFVPAWQASRTDLQQVLRDGRRSATAGGRWLRGVLLTVEVALSLVLLVGAALLLRSFGRLTSVDPGFQPERVLAFRVALPDTTYPEDPQRIAFYDRLLERLAAMPGASAAGVVQTLPMRGGYVLSFSIEGRPTARPGEEASANHRAISADYFRTLGIPLLRGRTFTAQDGERSPLVAVVDQAFVERHFPNEDPIGRGLDIGNGTDGVYRIVGVVGNVRQAGLDEVPAPTMYVPFRQDAFAMMWVVVRSDGDPAGLTGAARQQVRDLDPALPAFTMGPLSEVVSESVAQRRFSMLLLGLFALTALFLAGVGLYGIVAYGVSQRTQEIGLRMAIGAERRHVLRLVIGGGMKLALIGVLVGLPAALLLSRLVGSMLYDVTRFDPASYAATALVLLAVAALACYVPARRAVRVDPNVALRQE